MLTDTQVARAAKSKVPVTLKEGAGKGNGRLLMMVRPPLAEWYVQQWRNGKRTLRKLGNYPAMSLANARDKVAAEFLQTLRSGSPIKRHEGAKGATFLELANAYVAHLKASGKPSWEDAEQGLLRFAQIVGKKQAALVTQDDVIEFLRPVYARGAKSMADHLRSYVRSAYSWAMKSESDYRSEVTRRFGIRINPAANIPTEPKVTGERWLTPDELRTYWKWLNGGHRNETLNQINVRNLAALKLHILTGQRVQEVARISAATYNRMLGVIEWPTTKNGQPHVMPLPAQAVAIMEALEPNEHGLYFPAEFTPDQPVADGTLLSIVNRYQERTKARKFTNRDIRRTWKTLAGFAKLTKAERDMLQNHARTDVGSRHYDRYDYLDEKREAVKRWSLWFEANIENEPPENVVRIAR